jgi:hypothetical protein
MDQVIVFVCLGGLIIPFNVSYVTTVSLCLCRLVVEKLQGTWNVLSCWNTASYMECIVLLKTARYMEGVFVVERLCKVHGTWRDRDNQDVIFDDNPISDDRPKLLGIKHKPELNFFSLLLTVIYTSTYNCTRLQGHNERRKTDGKSQTHEAVHIERTR